jgi:AcrR family transcriptional regulator
MYAAGMVSKHLTDDDLDADAILELLETMRRGGDAEENEGLRERKKRRLRQRISNVATALFLTEGFDSVSVARIAAACEVSEPTVFNYFPTKESMFFDRSESSADSLAEAVRHRGDEALGTVVRDTLLAGISPNRWADVDETRLLKLSRRFYTVAEGSPTLRAAPYVQFPKVTAALAAALAERTGAQVDDPEVEFVAVAVAGLMNILYRATFTHIQTASSFAALDTAVRADVIRALRTAAPALDAFDADFPAAPTA